MSVNRRHLFDLFDSELCLVGAPNQPALVKEVRRLIHFLEQAPDALLEDVAYTCATTARKQPAILALVATSISDLLLRLHLVLPKLEEDAPRIRDKSGTFYFRDRLCPRGRIAFLFPGTISYYPDMLRDLCVAFEPCRELFDILTEAMNPLKLYPMDDIFPLANCYRNDGAARGATFPKALVAIHMANMALYYLFEQMGIAADGLLGFSGGDFSALAVAGVYGKRTHDKRVSFLRDGYQMLNSLASREDMTVCPMISVVDPPEGLIQNLLKTYMGRIAVSFYNSPRQITLAISPEVVDPVSKILAEKNVKTFSVAASEPFNTPWCAKALPSIRQFLSHWVRHTPTIPLYSCATADRMPTSPRAILRQLTDQWTLPIRFNETISKMYEDGFRVFIELGARGNMTNAVTETLKREPHLAVAVNRIHRSGLMQLHQALAALAAQGVQLDATVLHQHRRCHILDFNQPISAVPPPDHSLQLNSALPGFHLFVPSSELSVSAVPEQTSQQQNFAPDLEKKHRLDFGADFPMLANAEIISEHPGISLEIVKTLTLEDYPFLRDYAIGSTQISYANPQQKGLTILSQISGLEMMCETARKLSPQQRVARIDNLRELRWLAFEHGALRVRLHAERIACQEEKLTGIRVQLRDDSKDNKFTWPIMECFVYLTSEKQPAPPPLQPVPLPNPRQVNWSARDIYPERLFQGEGLQAIRHVDLWSEGGIDFELEVPSREHAVRMTHFPLFSIWPTLMDGLVASFSLWRSHEKFAGAISLPFRSRRITFFTTHFEEGARLRGYLRLFSVTPRSHVADLQVSDGNGHLLIQIKGWEELCERVPPEYQQFILRPSEKYITRELPLELIGSPKTPIAASVATDIPFSIFEHNEELWLKSLAHVLLAPTELEEWFEMQGATARRVEWLFGRAVAKEATRRYLTKYHQARWTAADIPIWPDDQGKPHPLGMWKEHTHVDIDLSIAHTSKLVVAAVVANAHIGLDVEILGRVLSDEFTQGVFSHDELELAANTGESPVSILFFWCAKEAISKALGTGIRYSPRDLNIVSYHPVEGYLEVELVGQWLGPFKQFKGRRNVVKVSVYEGHAFASCLLPSSLFEGN